MPITLHQVSDNQFTRLRQLVHEYTGIYLEETKREMIRGRLSKRLRALNLDDFEDYCEILQAGNTEELEQFANSITTNLTSFFRELHHYDLLRNELLPQITAGGNRRIRVWSAGCSSGEEPYSIAITILEAIPALADYDVRILATDLDTQTLNRAKRGIYSIDRIDNLPVEIKRRWFFKGTGNNAGLIKVSRELQQIIRFSHHNLVGNWPMKGPFDVVFFRNVAIYFDKPTRREIFEHFAQRQEIGGHLLIGHAETLNQITDRYELCAKTAYQKVK